MQTINMATSSNLSLSPLGNKRLIFSYNPFLAFPTP